MCIIRNKGCYVKEGDGMKKYVMLLCLFLLMLVPNCVKAGWYNVNTTVNGKAVGSIDFAVYSDSSCKQTVDIYTTNKYGKASVEVFEENRYYYQILNDEYEQFLDCNKLPIIPTYAEESVEIKLTKENEIEDEDKALISLSVGFLNSKTNEYVSGVKYSICMDVDCDAYIYTSSNKMYDFGGAFLDVGTWNIIVYDVPNGYQETVYFPFQVKASTIGKSLPIQILLNPIENNIPEINEPETDEKEEKPEIKLQKFSIGFQNKNENLIKDIKYSIYKDSSCEGNLLQSGTSSDSVLKVHELEYGTYYIKTTSETSGYKALSCTKFEVSATSKYKVFSLTTKENTSSNQNTSNNNSSSNKPITNNNSNNSSNNKVDINKEENTFGNIKISVIDNETRKLVSDIKIKICTTANCKEVLYQYDNSFIEQQLDFGTYYLVVADFPEKYQKPDSFFFTIDKEENTFEKVIVLESKQNTINLTILKISVICVCIAIIIAIIIYFVKKVNKEEVE